MPPKTEDDYEDEYEDEYEEVDAEELAQGDGEDYEGKVEEASEEGGQPEMQAGQGEDEEEEDEEEEEEEVDVATPWAGLAKLPEREEVTAYLQDLKDAGYKQINVLLLGKSSVGKSSTVNSLLGEAVARVQAFKLQADAEMVTPFVKEVGGDVPEAEGFRIKIIDTCGLEDPESGDAVHYAALRKIADSIKGQSIDCVLYCDRLDLYRVDPLDKSIIQAVSDTFGRKIWKKTLLVLTRGNLTQTPPGTDYDSFADRRVRALRRCCQGRNPLFRPSLPALLVENSADTCPTDKDGKRLLPDGSQWVVSLMEAITDMAMSSRPYRYRPGLTRKPNQQFKWLLPLIMAGQYLLWRDYLQPQIRHNLDRQQAADDNVWAYKAEQRRKLGIGPPLKPNKENAWRLEQIYDDD